MAMAVMQMVVMRVTVLTGTVHLASIVRDDTGHVLKLDGGVVDAEPADHLVDPL